MFLINFMVYPMTLNPWWWVGRQNHVIFHMRFLPLPSFKSLSTTQSTFWRIITQLRLLLAQVFKNSTATTPEHFTSHLRYVFFFLTLLTNRSIHYPYKIIAIRIPRVIHAKQILQPFSVTAHKAALAGVDVPKGYFMVYVGEQERSVCDSDIIFESAFIPRFVSSSRGRILFVHPMGGLSIPCGEEVFINLTSRLGRL